MGEKIRLAMFGGRSDNRCEILLASVNIITI